MTDADVTNSDVNTLNPDNFGKATFEQWSEILEGIYGQRNKARSASEMWLRAVSDASKVGEAVRKREYYDVLESLAHTMGWVLSTVRKLLAEGASLASYDGNGFEGGLTSIILMKFPMACAYCGGLPCECASMRKVIETEDKKQRRRRLDAVRERARTRLQDSGDRPRRIDDIAQMFWDIYGAVNYGASLSTIAFHFLEEIGEVSWCITSNEDGSRHNEDLVPINVQTSEEFADVCAWCMAILGQLNHMADQSSLLLQVFSDGAQERSEIAARPLKHPHASILARWLWKIYYDPNRQAFVCPNCHAEKCEC